MIDNTQIGNKLRQARIQNKLTQGDVARAVGVNTSTIARYEKGLIKKIKLPVVETMARFLGVNPAWVIGKSDMKPLSNDYNTLCALLKSTPFDILKNGRANIEVSTDTAIEQFLVLIYKILDSDDKIILWNKATSLIMQSKYNDFFTYDQDKKPYKGTGI